MDFVREALDKRIGQARERLSAPAPTDSPWTLELLGHLADEAEAALAHFTGEGEESEAHCSCGQPIVWIEDDPEGGLGHWEHNIAEAYWGGDHDIDEDVPEGWRLS